MATWNGWENQFLSRAGIIVTPPNRALLDQWAAHAHSSCTNNPIDMTAKLTGSTRCAANTGINTPTQRYTSHAQAANAFKTEIHEPWAAQLLKAMNTGNPYQVSYADSVGSVFVSWGSPDMLNAYLDAASSGGGSGGGGTGGPAPGAHKGWTHLRRTVNHGMPKALATSQSHVHAALRSLGHAHKVKG